MSDHRALVERVQNGDVAAFDGVVRLFADFARGLAYARLGDFHHAEDAAQEVFVHAYLAIGQLRDPAAIPGWFRRIVLKFCDRHSRKWGRVAPRPEAEVIEQVYRGAWRSRYLEWDALAFWICENVMEAYERLACEELVEG